MEDMTCRYLEGKERPTVRHQYVLRALEARLGSWAPCGLSRGLCGWQVTVGEEGFFDANGPNADLNPWGLPNNVQILGSRWCVLYPSGKNTGHVQVDGSRF